VLNGTRGIAVAPSAGGGVTIAAEHRLIRLSPDYLADGHLAYGYAATIHKSQGETVDRGFVLANASLFREAGYVALSRARVRTDLYVRCCDRERPRRRRCPRGDSSAVEVTRQVVGHGREAR
jgi:hypothetical protein